MGNSVWCRDEIFDRNPDRIINKRRRPTLSYQEVELILEDNLVRELDLVHQSGLAHAVSNSYNYLQVDFTGDEESLFLNQLCENVLPTYSYVVLFNISHKVKMLTPFLDKSLPNQIISLKFCGVVEEWPNLKNYIRPLTNCAYWVKQTLWISNFTIEWEDLETILWAYSEISQIIFDNCKFRGVETTPNFMQGREFELTALSFQNCNLSKSSMKHIIDSMFSSSLRYSLVTLNVYNTGVDVMAVKRLVNFYNLKFEVEDGQEFTYFKL